MKEFSVTAAHLELRADLRTFMRLLLGSLEIKERQTWDQAIRRNLDIFFSSKMPLLHPKWKGMLGVYAPLQNEVDWTLLWQNQTLLFPLVESLHEMAFYPSRLDDLKEVNVFSNSEIKIRSPRKTNPVIPKVVLVPGLMFTRKGGRLGRGKGYYDRYLAGHRPLTIGVAYEVQLSEELPLDYQDFPMDYLITEAGFFECARVYEK